MCVCIHDYRFFLLSHASIIDTFFTKHIIFMSILYYQAVYSTFTSFGLYGGSVATRHLDIFSGSGSVGLESLSRGSAHCTFVDLARECCDCCQIHFETSEVKVSDDSDSEVEVVIQDCFLFRHNNK